MKKLLLLLLFPALLNAQWVSAYYAGWMQGNQWSWHLQAQDIDYSAVTHIIHFSIDPKADGSFAWSDLSDWQCKEAVKYAHQAGKKILFSVGGWGSWPAFNNALKTDSIRAIFVGTLVNFMATYGYDGIDIDAEPINNPARWQTFIRELRAAMPSGKLLACAMMTEDAAVVPVASLFDQINIMTYDMSGAWPGWVSWHNAPIFNGGKTFPSTGGALPCADDAVDFLVSRGVPKEKIGIGLDWYGYAWKGGSGTPTGGVTEPFQSYATDPSVEANIAYFDIKKRWPSVGEKWDASAQAAYLSIDAATNSEDYFVSLDNEKTGQAKIDYVRQKGIGGLIIWELGGGYQPGATPPDKLLKALKAAYGGEMPVDTIPPPIVEPCDTVFITQPDSLSYWLGFRDGSSTSDTVFVLVPGPRDTVFVLTPGPRDTLYIPVYTPPDTVFVAGLKDTLYVIPKQFQLKVVE